ncbi:MAG: ABC transporter substrate-binding protein [Deltaproteobacteria bacterium]|nr:ABC transporter substrate-binding protein [Deltaproteobacteria bacterium]
MSRKMSGKGLVATIPLAALIVLVVLGLLATSTTALAKGRKLKILCTTALSGPLGAFGTGYDKAMRLAVEEINAAGMKGWSGIDYKAVDTETKPSVMQQKLLREAKAWKPDVVTAAVLETTIRVWCARLPQLKIPGFVGGHAGMSKYMPPGEVPLTKWVAYYGFPEYFSGWIAGKAFHELGAKRVAFIGGDYDWGYGNSIGLKAYWQENGRPFEIIMIGYTPLDKADLTTEVLLIKDAKVDGIFVPYTGAGWWALPKMLRDAGAMPKYFIWEASYGTLGQAKISGEYGAEGTYSIADHNPESDAWKGWVKKWRNKFGEKSYPEMYTHNYYQGIYWIKKVFEKLGPENRDPDKVVEMMQKTSFQNVCISPMGPLGPYGGNLGAKASLVQFVKGAAKDLDPSFGLHPELKAIYDLGKWDMKSLLEKMKALKRLEKGEKYPAAH